MPHLRRLWYPEGVKRVPSHMKLTGYSLKIFYIEDGTLSRVGSRGKLSLAVNNFSLDDVETIKNRIADIIGDDRVIIHNYKSGPTIHISRKSTVSAFYDCIGECPDEIKQSFGYKWM